MYMIMYLATLPIKAYKIIVAFLTTGTPRVLRADRGTENSIIAFVQPSLRSQHLDDLAKEKSFRYGKSTSNQVCSYQ